MWVAMRSRNQRSCEITTTQPENPARSDAGTLDRTGMLYSSRIASSDHSIAYLAEGIVEGEIETNDGS